MSEFFGVQFHVKYPLSSLEFSNANLGKSFFSNSQWYFWRCSLLFFSRTLSKLSSSSLLYVFKYLSRVMFSGSSRSLSTFSCWPLETSSLPSSRRRLFGSTWGVRAKSGVVYGFGVSTNIYVKNWNRNFQSNFILFYLPKNNFTSNYACRAFFGKACLDFVHFWKIILFLCLNPF